MSIDFQFDKNWSLYPIHGDTGKSYMGINESEKVFIKINSSPFLAALSREGISPRLVWTKRTGDGDILTAQEWLDGTLLSPTEVGNRLDVVRTLQHLHHSNSLKNMLYRVGGKEFYAFDFLTDYAENLPNDLKQNKYLRRVFRFLEDHIPNAVELCACHGDPTHNNWLLSDNDRLYLVDWDSSMLADPATDLATVLGRYVPLHDWTHWLASYGLPSDQESYERVYWYSGINLLLRIKAAHLHDDFQRMNHEILLLKQIYSY